MTPSPDYPRTMFHRSLAAIPPEERNAAWERHTTVVKSEAEEVALGAEWSRTIPPFDPEPAALPSLVEKPEPRPAAGADAIQPAEAPEPARKKPPARKRKA